MAFYVYDRFIYNIILIIQYIFNLIKHVTVIWLRWMGRHNFLVLRNRWNELSCSGVSVLYHSDRLVSFDGVELETWGKLEPLSSLELAYTQSSCWLTGFGHLGFGQYFIVQVGCNTSIKLNIVWNKTTTFIKVK